MEENISKEEQKNLAELVKEECVKIALDAYEEASMRGLCHEGAWEYAIDAMKNIKTDELIIKTNFRISSK